MPMGTFLSQYDNQYTAFYQSEDLRPVFTSPRRRKKEGLYSIQTVQPIILVTNLVPYSVHQTVM